MSEFHRQVGRHFDEDAEEFDDRYWANPVLQRIRQAFREEVKRIAFVRALEVGCGPGLDLVHFGTIFPDKTFHGIDVSEGMIRLAEARIGAAGCKNVSATVASADDVVDRFDAVPFELVYVFFGALNTVEDLGRTAERLYAKTAPGGHLVLTFVNQLYLADIAINLVKGRFREAFRRFKPVWGGYSRQRFLPSKCLSPREVRAAFGRGGRELHRRGFSILYPAWYRARWVPKLRRASHWLWEADRWLNRTPMWCTGEYCLYVFRKHPVATTKPGAE